MDVDTNIDMGSRIRLLTFENLEYQYVYWCLNFLYHFWKNEITIIFIFFLEFFIVGSKSSLKKKKTIWNKELFKHDILNLLFRNIGVLSSTNPIVLSV